MSNFNAYSFKFFQRNFNWTKKDIKVIFVPTWLRKTFERKMLHSHFCTILFFALFERYLLRGLYCTILYGFFSPQVHGWLNALTDAFLRYFAEIAWFCKMGPEPLRNCTIKSFCHCNFKSYFPILNFHYKFGDC